ncbi:MAG TPA: hypothetical protein VHZ75_08755 [Solirubrobacteraceae bacterium]|jgi:hypothetical protein|nr:hypothetical protein [Solirubrobacteraceae bacterium]
MRTAVALCFLALTLAACGTTPKDSAKGFKGDQRTVADTVEGLESAARKNDAGKVCTQLLAQSLLAALKKQGTNCSTAVKEAFKDADSVDITVKTVTIAAAKATAKVTSGTGSNAKGDTLALVKVGTGWRISSLAG